MAKCSKCGCVVKDSKGGGCKSKDGKGGGIARSKGSPVYTLPIIPGKKPLPPKRGLPPFSPITIGKIKPVLRSKTK